MANLHLPRGYCVSIMAYMITIAIICTIAGSFTFVRAKELLEPLPIQTARDWFEAPKIIDFNTFMLKTHKQYKSQVEYSRRLKIYLANIIEVLISTARYKLKFASSYLGINQLSDRTDEELRKLHPRPCLKCTDYETCEDGGVSSSEENDDRTDRKLRAPGRVKKNRAHDFLTKSLKRINAVCRQKKVVEEQITVPDTLHIDHSGCLPSAKYQDTCGACYIIATISLYEWLYCDANKRKVEFSSQYVVDCGGRATPDHDGCNGGHEKEVERFVSMFGLEYASDYPWFGVQRICPVEEEVDPKYMGKLRLDVTELMPIDQAEIEKRLEVSPMIVTIGVESSFDKYGGGVDMGKCGKDAECHSVLLIGHGVEDGNEYWLIRNSYGEDWGHSGNYKLSKQTPCMFDQDIFYPKAKEDSVYSFLPNPFYDNRIIK